MPLHLNPSAYIAKCSLLLLTAVSAISVSAREVGRLHALYNSSVKIVTSSGKTIYIDPYGISGARDADLILITHAHPDHLSVGDISSLSKATTQYICPASCQSALRSLAGNEAVTVVAPGWSGSVGGFPVQAVSAYNITKSWHPQGAGNGYVISIDGVRVYHAGDTERVAEMKSFSCDVALVPLGQTYTMDSVGDAASSVLDVKARLAIPIHWGVNEGTASDAAAFSSLLRGRVEVVLNTGVSGVALEASGTAPAIASHPASATVAPGNPATLAVTASGDAPLSYQWRKGGTAIAGATQASYTLPAANTPQAGDYDVVVSNASGSTVSRFARLVVAVSDPGRIVNMSIRTSAGVAGEPLIVGFVSRGQKPLLVRAIGPALSTLFGVSGTLTDPRLDIHQIVDGKDSIVDTNDNWSAPPADVTKLSNAFAAVGAFALPQASADSAVVLNVDGGRTVHVNAARAGASGIVLVESYDAGSGNNARLVNVSARNNVGTGDDILIAGFVINGNTPKRLLIRGIGPALGTLFNVQGALADPKIELHTRINDVDTVVAKNDNWGDEPGAADAASSVAAFALPGGSKDAVLVVTVPPGAYTAQVSSTGASTGNSLVEIYELP